MIIGPTLPVRQVLETTNEELQSVLADVVPDLRWQFDQLKALNGQRLGGMFAGNNDDLAVGELASKTAEELLATGHLSSEFAADAWKAAHAGDVAAAATSTLALVEKIIAGKIGNLVLPQRDAILTGLNDQLQIVIAEARKLPTMVGADEAITAGLVKEWQKFAALRSRNRLLRAAQTTVMVAFQGSWQETPARTAGYFARYPLVDPTFYRPRDGLGFDYGLAVPEDEADRFAWVVSHADVQVWIPTTPELEQALLDERSFATLAKESNPEVRTGYAKTMGVSPWIAAHFGVALK